MDINTSCSNCQNGIHKQPSHLTKYKFHFCNRKCKTEHERKNKVWYEVKCDFCGKINKRDRLNHKATNHFCGKGCANKFSTKHKLWSHYKENPKRAHDRKPTILAMTNSTCQICGFSEDKRMLDIHHIDKNRKNNSFENLACICVWCHAEHHRLGKYQKMPNVLESK